MEPEEFYTRLQPSVVPFLKQSLPFLQDSLASGELTLEGITAPCMDQVRLVTNESDL